MPIYEYRCHHCGRRVSLLWRSISEAERGTPVCPRCHSKDLTRLVSRVSALRSEESHLEAIADPSALGGLDENDPRSIGRWMRKMSHEMGEEMGDELNEVIDRLEAGESPEEIEKTMPEMPGGGDFDSGSDFGIGSVGGDM